MAYLQSLVDGEAVNPAMSSSVCGDGRFHALPAGEAPGTWVVEEECDDGDDDERDLCTSACQVSDTLVEFQEPYIDPSSGRSMPWLNKSRSLGEGRHPVGAHGHGFAVAYVEPGNPRGWG